MKVLYVNINGEKIDSTEDVVVVGKVEDAIINRFYFELGKEVLKGVVAPSVSSIKKKDIILDFKVHDESAFNAMMEQWEAFKCQLLGDNPVGEFAVKLPAEYISWLKDSSLPVYAEVAKSLYQRGGVVSIGINKVYTNISNLIVNNIDDGGFASVVVNDNLVTDDSALVMAIQKKFPSIVFKPFEEWEVEVETMQSQIAEDVEEEKSTDIVVDHRMVDLGLSVCWADCNVGANSPEEYGGCFDLKNYDRAVCDWEPEWRLPTKKEIEELCKKCAWVWTKINGVSGFTIIGPNENKIFLPAAGYNETGNYWSTTKFERNGHHGAYYLRFFISSDENRCYFCYADCERNEKRSIRAVIDRNI